MERADTESDRCTTRLPRSATAPLEARLVAAGPHVEQVADVGRAPGGDLLLVLQEAPVGLPELLAASGPLPEGEAVTVLAPLAGAIVRMHAVGVAHGAVGVAAIRFDDAGTPLWCGFEAACVRRVAGPEAFAAAVDADRAAFGALVGELLHGPGARTGTGAALADRPLEELEEALFDVAEPQPVRLRPRRAPEPVPGWAPGRLGPLLDPGDLVDTGGTAPAGRLRGLLGRARTVVAPVRARVWVAAGAAVALLVAATVLLPARAPDAGAEPTLRPTSSALVERSRREVAPRALAPVAAVSALLVARRACLDRSDATCLDGVDAAGSPVLTTDRAAARAGAEVHDPRGAAVVRWRSGGTTLVRFADGSDVLAVREPAGWRLRDVVAVR